MSEKMNPCPFCNGDKLELIQDQVDRMIGNTRVLCRQCGATASLQQWAFLGDDFNELNAKYHKALKLLKTNAQVFRSLLECDESNVIGRITEKMQAFDAFLVNKAFLDEASEQLKQDEK